MIELFGFDDLDYSEEIIGMQVSGNKVVVATNRRVVMFTVEGDEYKKDEAYTCKYCGEKFSSPQKLATHTRYCKKK